MREIVGMPLPPTEQANIDVRQAELKSRLGEAGFAAAFSAGLAMRFDDAVADGLRCLSDAA